MIDDLLKSQQQNPENSQTIIVFLFFHFILCGIYKGF